MTSPLTAAPLPLPPQVTPPPVSVAAEKHEASRFDGVLADKANAPSSPSAPREVAPSSAVPPVASTERTVLHGISRFVQELEQGQRVLDDIIQSASSGAHYSNAELLALQASMYRYTQSLDLVSRVVEKGTSGLKDVLKTQV
ncbi:ATP-dependent helicase HrpB [Myxococcus sp. CA040A]|uniref:ATP-dependent helicase HrpB n=1 Tax=Myxococcus sp. CA040A TaxID=2741738 RepID=UPI00157B2394|nr:ATP-dependent helicase HrpB [Myxococcus sp. CA040A]NTX07476.1 ATP-dependent helicase HrpB [Myxococcus sp. CA040A]